MAKRSGVSLGVLALAAAGAAASLLSDCADSTSWYYEDRAKTCEAYVSKKSKHCKKKDEFGIKASQACPATCGGCDDEDRRLRGTA